MPAVKEKISMEVLAPAGSVSAFEVAMAKGADAVYVGAPGFNARALARDFSFAEIAAMVKFAHRRKKKIYIAMNSLLKEDELGRVIEVLLFLSRVQPDALIIQDFGLCSLVHRFFPTLVLHASTLMSVHNSQAADWLGKKGFERVVLARELTIAEIEQISHRCGVELEVFVHGAMCFSYSGLCLFSSLHGGKSSMRGKCVQPCRRRYGYLTGRGAKVKGGGYLFSMNDLSAIALLPELQWAGVVSLKIEGRLKSVEYVRKTVEAYRLVLDGLRLPKQEQTQLLTRAQRLLDEAMGRKRATGYFLDSQPKQAVSPGVSGNAGILLGKVVKVFSVNRGSRQVTLRLSLARKINLGERLRLHDEVTGKRQSFTLKNLQVRGKNVKFATAGQTAQIVVDADLLGRNSRNRGQLVFRVDVHASHKKNRGKGQLKVVAVQPISQQERIRQGKILQALSWQPVNEQNKERRTLPGSGKKRNTRQPRESSVRWWVRVRSPLALNQRLPVRPACFLVPLCQDSIRDWARGRRRLRKFIRQIIWCLPPVIAEDQLSWYGEALEQLQGQGAFRFQLGHISQLDFFVIPGGTTSPGVQLYGDYTLNILNSSALHYASECGFQGVQFSIETDRKTLAGALTHFFRFEKKQGHVHASDGMKVGMYVFGRPPLFTARLQAEHFRSLQPVVSPKNEHFQLEQAEGMTFARAEFPFSLLSYRNELQRLGVNYLVADLSGGPIKKELAVFSTLLRPVRGKQPSILQGNYAGTLM